MPEKSRRRPARARKHEGVLQHAEEELHQVAEAIESRFLEAGQVATGTSSAEVNLATAAVEGIIGDRDAGAGRAQKRRAAPHKTRAGRAAAKPKGSGRPAAKRKRSTRR